MRLFLATTLLLTALGASAASYDVRRDAAASSYAYYASGADIRDTLTAGDSVFFGVHFSMRSWPSSDVAVIFSVSDGAVGAHRYFRLQIAEADRAFEVQGRELGDAGDATHYFDTGQVISLSTWYAGGVLIEPLGATWRFTTFIQPHGGSVVTITNTVDATVYTNGSETRDLYGLWKHAYYSGGVNTAHQTSADKAAPVVVVNPTRSEVDQYIATADPATLWSGADYLMRPDFSDWTEDGPSGGSWTRGGTDPSLNGTLTLGTTATGVSNSVFQILFNGSETVGQYVDGTYWVVGSVTITNTTPASVSSSGRVINGGMVNPPHIMLGSQGFDQNYYSAGYNYSAGLNALRPSSTDLSSANPLTLTAGQSLVLSKSVTSSSTPRPTFSDFWVLTSVSSPPLVGSFRPTVMGTDKASYWRTNDIDYSRLLTLTVPSGWPALSTVTNNWANFWIDLDASPLTSQNFHPTAHMESYGGDMAYDSSDALMALNLNYTHAQKTPLLLKVLQWGIDLSQQRTVGEMIWFANGGHGIGRKPVILFTGHVLGSASIIASGTNTYATLANSTPPYDDRYIFQEDGQTWTPAASDIGRSMSQDNGNARETYAQIHVGIDEWGIEHDHWIVYDDSRWDAAYRDINTGRYIPFALVMRLMGLTSYWSGSDVRFFRYADRAYVEYFDSYASANQMTAHWKTAMTDFREAQLTWPLPPDGISAGSATSSAITVSWSNNSTRETGTIVQYSTGGDTYTTATTTAANATSYQVTGLSPSTTYYFRIGNTNSATGEFSGWATGDSEATTGGGSAPTAPSGLSATPGSSTLINLSWTDNSSDEVTFRIERSTVGGGSGFSEVGSVSAGVTSNSDSGLTPSTLYYYRVRARNASGDSAYTSEASATTSAAASIGGARVDRIGGGGRGLIQY
jgi:hypothetical protein